MLVPRKISIARSRTQMKRSAPIAPNATSPSSNETHMKQTPRDMILLVSKTRSLKV